MKISVLLLVKNEEAMIENCLKQFNFADEIIILDQNSQDNTISISKKYTTNILQTKSTDFAKNRTLLKENAKGEWLLYADADERFPQHTIEEIQKIIQENQKYSVYYFPRKNYIFEKWLKHGGWWPDYVPRLFKCKDLEKWIGEIHESPIVIGKVKYLKTPLEHLSARSMTQMFNKSIKWAKIEAGLYADSKSPQVTIIRVLKATFVEFLKRYFLKLGVLDGFIGLVESTYQSVHKAAILTYLWEIQNKNKINK